MTAEGVAAVLVGGVVFNLVMAVGTIWIRRADK